MICARGLICIGRIVLLRRILRVQLYRPAVACALLPLAYLLQRRYMSCIEVDRRSLLLFLYRIVPDAPRMCARLVQIGLEILLFGRQGVADAEIIRVLYGEADCLGWRLHLPARHSDAGIGSV